MNTPQFSKAKTLEGLLADYEAIVRLNRPDWVEFLEEAESEVDEIVYEVMDFHDDLAGTICPGLSDGDAYDVVRAAVVSWLSDKRRESGVTAPAR
jgi:hypothetical protein